MRKIINLTPFVKTKYGQIGIAQGGSFASIAWRISEEAFNNIRGNKFVWITPNGSTYTDDRSNFLRPTEEEVVNGITPMLLGIAIKEGLIEIVPEEKHTSGQWNINAKLIALAPEMFELLQELAGDIDAMEELWRRQIGGNPKYSKKIHEINGKINM